MVCKFTSGVTVTESPEGLRVDVARGTTFELCFGVAMCILTAAVVVVLIVGLVIGSLQEAAWNLDSILTLVWLWAIFGFFLIGSAAVHLVAWSWLGQISVDTGLEVCHKTGDIRIIGAFGRVYRIQREDVNCIVIGWWWNRSTIVGDVFVGTELHRQPWSVLGHRRVLRKSISEVEAELKSLANQVADATGLFDAPLKKTPVWQVFWHEVVPMRIVANHNWYTDH